jgi:hypothetical protein
MLVIVAWLQAILADAKPALSNETRPATYLQRLGWHLSSRSITHSSKIQSVNHTTRTIAAALQQTINFCSMDKMAVLKIMAFPTMVMDEADVNLRRSEHTE